ncbi:unnamed protein product [Ambrosiozyma monospora]|uniref:Unnamed protein product n=1 Tax=Ambrosiozyma monospora TaxID=43982 RepID=A0ACB5SYV2_AMBMO|nr:unnamed protein product [Ambrosiozyma monospora]
MVFYAVTRGRTIGLFQDWESCYESTNNYPGGFFKEFELKQDAEVYLGENGVDVEQTEFPSVEDVVVHTFNHDQDQQQVQPVNGMLYDTTSTYTYTNSAQNQNTSHVNISQRNQLKLIHTTLTAILHTLNTSKQMPRIKYNIATDSKFAIRCITQWSIKWIQHNWINSRGYEVDNKDVLIGILDVLDEINDLYFKLMWGKLEFRLIERLKQSGNGDGSGCGYGGVGVRRKSVRLKRLSRDKRRDSRRDSLVSGDVDVDGGRDGESGIGSEAVKMRDSGSTGIDPLDAEQFREGSSSMVQQGQTESCGDTDVPVYQNELDYHELTKEIPGKFCNEETTIVPIRDIPSTKNEELDTNISETETLTDPLLTTLTPHESNKSSISFPPIIEKEAVHELSEVEPHSSTPIFNQQNEHGQEQEETVVISRLTSRQVIIQPPPPYQFPLPVPNINGGLKEFMVSIAWFVIMSIFSYFVAIIAIHVIVQLCVEFGIIEL